MSLNHPQKNDKGQIVAITHPSTPSSLDAWDQAGEIATTVPGAAMPATLNGIPFATWQDAPTKANEWDELANQMTFREPTFNVSPGKKPASGVVVLEADGRVWVVSPTNQFGGYKNTFAKGKLEAGHNLSLKGNALKEAFEEAGLQVELTGFLCDSKRDTSTTRYYLARRLGGNPAEMGWESQAVHLVPRALLPKLASHQNDKGVIQALEEQLPRLVKRENVMVSSTLTSALRIIYTVNAFRGRFGVWPTQIKLGKDMAGAIQEHVLTPVGWAMMASKVRIVRVEEGTVIAESGEMVFNYDDCTDAPIQAVDGSRADLWFWGLQLTD